MTHCSQCHQDEWRGVAEAGKMEKGSGFFVCLFYFVLVLAGLLVCLLALFYFGLI